MSSNSIRNIEDIMKKNNKVLKEFFAGIVSGDYYDGLKYTLYFNKSNNVLFIYQDVLDACIINNDDLYVIDSFSGRIWEIPEKKDRYKGKNIDKFGYQEFLKRVKRRIGIIDE